VLLKKFCASLFERFAGALSATSFELREEIFRMLEVELNEHFVRMRRHSVAARRGYVVQYLPDYEPQARR
jgi:hypothetical protein